MHLQHLSDTSIIFWELVFSVFIQIAVCVLHWCKYHCHYEAGFIEMWIDMFMMCVFGSIWVGDEDKFGDILHLKLSKWL